MRKLKQNKNQENVGLTPLHQLALKRTRMKSKRDRWFEGVQEISDKDCILQEKTLQREITEK
jgi:hypothetical protein